MSNLQSYQVKEQLEVRPLRIGPKPKGANLNSELWPPKSCLQNRPVLCTVAFCSRHKGGPPDLTLNALLFCQRRTCLQPRREERAATAQNKAMLPTSRVKCTLRKETAFPRCLLLKVSKMKKKKNLDQRSRPHLKTWRTVPKKKPNHSLNASMLRWAICTEGRCCARGVPPD